jgi:SAM-dependent methyltransferase
MQSDLTHYYDTRTGWGKQPNSANRFRIKKTLGLVPADVTTVLDIGCGDGIVSNALVERGIRTVGIDISKIALQHFRGTGIIGSINALPFPNSYFDLVLCAEVLEHLPPEIYRNALNETERITKRYILITTPNEEYLPASYVKCQKCRHKDDLVCPRCHHQGVSPKKQGLVWEFIFRVLRRLDYELPAHTQPRWIASLYRRK